MTMRARIPKQEIGLRFQACLAHSHQLGGIFSFSNETTFIQILLLMKSNQIKLRWRPLDGVLGGFLFEKAAASEQRFHYADNCSPFCRQPLQFRRRRVNSPPLTWFRLYNPAIVIVFRLIFFDICLEMHHKYISIPADICASKS